MQNYQTINPTDLLSDSRVKITNRDDAVRTWFWGASEPAVMEAGQPWIDTTAGKIKVRSGDNLSWIIIGNYDTELGLLSKAGGTMAGIINMNGQRITSLPTPGAGADPATRDYVDTAVSAALPKARGYLTADYTGVSAAWTKLTLDTQSFDTEVDPYGFILASSRFVAPSAGYYFVIGAMQIDFQFVSAGDYGLGAIYKNGAKVTEAKIHPAPATGTGYEDTIPLNDIIYLAQGDYVELYYFVSSTPILRGNSDKTYMVASKMK